jgi:hypothetical protein
MFSSRPSRLAAVAGALLLALGAAALWFSADRGQADATPALAPAVTPVVTVQPADAFPAAGEFEGAPPARRKSREEQRFARADRDDDGRITQAEYLHARRRNYDRLDRNGDGVLQFSEYAASGIGKFAGADEDGDGRLSPAEYAKTAPKSANRQTASAANCRCPRAGIQASSAPDAPD